MDDVVVVIIEDEEATLARFEKHYTTLLTDDIKARVVLENDDVVRLPPLPIFHAFSNKPTELERSRPPPHLQETQYPPRPRTS